MCLYIALYFDGIPCYKLATPIKSIFFHEFHCTGGISRPENSAHSRTRVFSRSKRNQHEQVIGSQRQEFQNYLSNDAQGPFTADDQLSEIVTCGVLEHISASPNY